jgi:hypothetical protein
MCEGKSSKPNTDVRMPEIVKTFLERGGGEEVEYVYSIGLGVAIVKDVVSWDNS